MLWVIRLKSNLMLTDDLSTSHVNDRDSCGQVASAPSTALIPPARSASNISFTTKSGFLPDPNQEAATEIHGIVLILRMDNLVLLRTFARLQGGRRSSSIGHTFTHSRRPRLVENPVGIISLSRLRLAPVLQSHYDRMRPEITCAETKDGALRPTDLPQHDPTTLRHHLSCINRTASLPLVLTRSRS